MSYSIYFDKWGQLGEEYDNLTWDEISNNDEFLSETDAFEYWFNDVNDKCLDSYIQDGLDNEILEQVDDFRSSDSFFDLQDSYIPIYNYVHILSSNIYDEAVLMISKYVGNIVVVHLNDMDVDVLALTGCGMDLSDNIELAYYLSDGESPVRASQVMSLSKNAEKLLNFCRHRAENGRVSMYEIEQFIASGYQVEEEK